MISVPEDSWFEIYWTPSKVEHLHKHLATLSRISKAYSTRALHPASHFQVFIHFYRTYYDQYASILWPVILVRIKRPHPNKLETVHLLTEQGCFFFLIKVVLIVCLVSLHCGNRQRGSVARIKLECVYCATQKVAEARTLMWYAESLYSLFWITSIATKISTGHPT